MAQISRQCTKQIIHASTAGTSFSVHESTSILCPQGVEGSGEGVQELLIWVFRHDGPAHGKRRDDITADRQDRLNYRTEDRIEAGELQSSNCSTIASG